MNRGREGFGAPPIVGPGLFVASADRYSFITIDKQLVSVEAGFEYRGGIVPRRSDQEEEILKAAKMAALALALSGRAGIELVVGDLPRVVDVNPHPRAAPVGRIIPVVPKPTPHDSQPIGPRAPSTRGRRVEAGEPRRRIR